MAKNKKVEELWELEEEGEVPEADTGIDEGDSGDAIEPLAAAELPPAEPEPAEPEIEEAEPILVKWVERLRKGSRRRLSPLEDLEGFVVGEKIGAPYYVILGGQRHLLVSIEQAMGFGAVHFLHPEELAKIPEGGPMVG